MSLPEVGELTPDGAVIRVTEHWIVTVAPMIYNHRIVLSQCVEDWPRHHTAGWCYDSMLDAHLAAAIFDPEVDRAPAGYKKMAYDLRHRLLGCDRCSRQDYDAPPNCGQPWCPPVAGT